MIFKIQQELKNRFLEREGLIDASLTAFLCREHVMIIGPPGTAKSMLAHNICERIIGTKYFQWLLTKFTTPEELFGPISLKGLENDKYYRITVNKLPEAHIAFLDEIFKANSSILNTLLTLINERKYFNGDEVQSVPLISLFASCNESPQSEQLKALYDRFLFRFQVGYIKDDENFKRMLKQARSRIGGVMKLSDLEKTQNEVAALSIPDGIIDVLTSLREILNKLDIKISDRRYKQSLGALKAYAWLHGDKKVEIKNLEILKSIFWNSPDEVEKTVDAIDSFIFPLQLKADSYVQRAAEIYNILENTYYAEDEVKAVTREVEYKMQSLNERFKDLVILKKNNGEEIEVDKIIEQFKEINIRVELKCYELKKISSPV